MNHARMELECTTSSKWQSVARKCSHAAPHKILDGRAMPAVTHARASLICELIALILAFGPCMDNLFHSIRQDKVSSR
jgi:hypothetical protein